MVSWSRSRSTIFTWMLTWTTHRSGGSLAKVVVVTLAANPFAWVVVNHICEVVPMLTRLNGFTATAAVTQGGYSSKNACCKLGTGSTSSGWRHHRHEELFWVYEGFMITGTKEKNSYARPQASSYTNECRSHSDNYEGK